MIAEHLKVFGLASLVFGQENGLSGRKNFENILNHTLAIILVQPVFFHEILFLMIHFRTSSLVFLFPKSCRGCPRTFLRWLGAS